jgi:replicative DNA helicase
MSRPVNEYAERTILGAMLLERSAVSEAMMSIEPDDFSLDSHKRVYAAMAALEGRGEPIDLITTKSELERRKEMDAIGGMGYLLSLTEGIPRNLSVASYCRIVRDKSLLRQVQDLCERGMADASDQAEESLVVLNRLSERLHEIALKGSTISPVSIAEVIVPTWEEMKHQREFKGELIGITTGIPELDRYTTGWRSGELTYVGALPGRGKTSFMLQAMYAAAVSGHGVGCISLEMRSSQLLKRLAIMDSGLHAFKYRDVRTMNASEWEHARHSMFNNLGNLPITMCDQSGLNPMQISSLARQMHARGAEVIFVDFVQIIASEEKNRKEVIDRVSASLRDTCKALNIPFVVASQLTRRDADPNRRPTLQDLRESGNLEQDAHNVLMLFRPKDKSTGDWSGADEIIIEKAREGMTGIVPVRYNDKSLTYGGRAA